MTHEQQYNAFIEQMKQLKASKPYMSFADWKIANDIKDEEEHVPFVARKSSSHKNVEPTMQNHLLDVTKMVSEKK